MIFNFILICPSIDTTTWVEFNVKKMPAKNSQLFFFFLAMSLSEVTTATAAAYHDMTRSHQILMITNKSRCLLRFLAWKSERNSMSGWREKHFRGGWRDNEYFMSPATAENISSDLARCQASKNRQEALFPSLKKKFFFSLFYEKRRFLRKNERKSFGGIIIF